MNQILDNEILSRFIMQSNWVRADKTIHKNAFSPPSHLRLSVTRNITLNEEQLNNFGKTVAQKRKTKFYGRAEISTAVVRDNKLDVEAAPLAENNNHADIIGWAEEKDLQMLKAAEIALKAKFIEYKDVF